MQFHTEGYGDIDIEATAHTLVLYEQEFKSDLIKDVFGKREQAKDADGSTVVLFDYTVDNWNDELKALWAMAKTANDIANDAGEVAPKDRITSYTKWVKGLGKVNMRDVANAVVSCCMDGFFHTGAAVSE